MEQLLQRILEAILDIKQDYTLQPRFHEVYAPSAILPIMAKKKAQPTKEVMSWIESGTRKPNN